LNIWKAQLLLSRWELSELRIREWMTELWISSTDLGSSNSAGNELKLKTIL